MPQAELQLVYFGHAPVLEARNEDGSLVTTPVVTAVAGEPQTIALHGRALRTVVVRGRERALLLVSCVQEEAARSGGQAGTGEGRSLQKK